MEPRFEITPVVPEKAKLPRSVLALYVLGGLLLIAAGVVALLTALRYQSEVNQMIEDLGGDRASLQRPIPAGSGYEG